MTKRASRPARRSRNKTNPLQKSGGTIPRPKMRFDGQYLTCTLYGSQSAIGGTTATLGSDWHSADCSSGEGMNRAGSDVVKHYQDYKYTSAFLEWLPSIGPSHTDSGGRVYIAYIDNPELIVTFKAATDVNKLPMVRNCANVRDFNMWERFTYRVPLTYRRRMFNVNPTIGTPGNEETDRAIQGLIVISYVSISNTPAAATLGQWRIVSTTWLRGFTATTLT